MAASGSYAALFRVADIMDEAWERCGYDPAEIDARKILSARRSLNLVLRMMSIQDADKENRIEGGTITTVAGTSSYALPVGTIDIIDCKHTDASGQDTFMSKMTRQENWQIENLGSTGTPALYYVDRSLTGDPDTDVYEIIVHPTPDVAGTLDYFRLREAQRVTALNEHVDASPYFEEAVIAGLAAKLSEKFALDRYPALMQMAQSTYRQAQMEANPRGEIVIAGRGIGRSRRRRV